MNGPGADEALQEAIGKLDLNGVRRAIEAGADVDVDVERTGTSPLYVATAAHHDAALEIVRALIGANARIDLFQGPTSGGTTVLCLAMAHWQSCSQIAQLLLESGADPNFGPPDRRPIFLAHRSAEAVEWLLRCGADLNVLNDDGQTPLEAYDEFVVYWAEDRRSPGAPLDWEEVAKIRVLLEPSFSDYL